MLFIIIIRYTLNITFISCSGKEILVGTLLHNALVCDALCNVSWSECVASVSVCHPSHYLTRCLFWGDLIRITHTRLNFHTLLTRRVQRGIVCITHYWALQCVFWGQGGWGRWEGGNVGWGEAFTRVTHTRCHATMSRQMVEERRQSRKRWWLVRKLIVSQ